MGLNTMGASDDLWPRPPESWADQPLELLEPVDEGRFDWVLPTVAGLLSLAWLAAALLFSRTSLATMDPAEIAEFVAALCVPPALIGVAWLLLQRNSRAEARRFGVTVRGMRAETSAMEARVASLSRTLAAQRELLVAQLDAGTAAAARLEVIGRGMADQVDEADAHARSLAETAERARATVGDLLASIPQARTESEEVGRRIDAAGLTAAAQAAAL